MKKIALVISVEHAVNTIPVAYQSLFSSHESVLNTHRGVDFGAKALGEHLAACLPCDYQEATASRLLIDCNRSLNHPKCFSEWTQPLTQDEKDIIIHHYYLPFREPIEQCIERHIQNNRQVFHLSVHSFTPELNGITRNAAIGLLYDPTRHAEKEIARIWHTILTHTPPDYNIRMNYPYRGASEGFVSALRKKYSEQVYVGFELENNQTLVQDAPSFETLKDIHAKSLMKLIEMI